MWSHRQSYVSNFKVSLHFQELKFLNILVKFKINKQTYKKSQQISAPPALIGLSTEFKVFEVFTFHVFDFSKVFVELQS